MSLFIIIILLLSRQAVAFLPRINGIDEYGRFLGRPSVDIDGYTRFLNTTTPIKPKNG